MDAGALLNTGGALFTGEVMPEAVVAPDVGRPFVASAYKPSRGMVPAREGRGGGVDVCPLSPPKPAVRPFMADAAFPYPAEYLFGFGDAFADPFP